MLTSATLCRNGKSQTPAVQHNFLATLTSPHNADFSCGFAVIVAHEPNDEYDCDNQQHDRDEPRHRQAFPLIYGPPHPPPNKLPARCLLSRWFNYQVYGRAKSSVKRFLFGLKSLRPNAYLTRCS